MSSYFEDIQNALGSPCGQYFHGESITHRPLNVSDDDATVTVVWDEMEPIESQDERGKVVIRKAVALVPTSVSVAKKDTWIKSSEVWETVALGVTVGDQREISVKRTERIKTKNKGSKESDDLW